MTTCTFAGHRDVFQADIPKKLDKVISQILAFGDNSYRFLVGVRGQFDEMCSSAVRKVKREHKDKQITLVLVLPYFSQELNTNKEYYDQFYDDVVIPSELADVHYKAVITKRNRWLIEQSDILIAFVYRNFGGAYTTINYAIKKEKRVINLADSNP